MSYPTIISTTTYCFNLSDETINLLFSASNPTSASKKICMYNSPLEGMIGDFLEVKKANGEKIEYTGILMKRGEPTKEDYMKIGANKIISTSFNLKESYDIQEEGIYYVQFKGNEYMNKFSDSNILEIKIK